MAIIYVNEEFAEDIETRRKRRTIRREKKCGHGDEIELVCSSNDRLLDTVTCHKVLPVYLDITGLWIYGEKLYAGWARKDDFADDFDSDFAKSLGFSSGFQEMVRWYDEHYGLPFSGYLHDWL